MTGFFNTFCGICSKAHVYSGSKQFADDVELQKGRHQFAFGGEWIRRTTNYQTSTQQDASYSFNGQITGFALTDLLLGLPSSFIQGNLTLLDYQQNYLALYASDKIRLNSRLTANAGLRWEPYLPEAERQRRATHFDLAAFRAGTQSVVFHNAPPGVFFPGDSGMPRAGTNNHLINLSPRAGLIWDVRGNAQTIVRAGYGVLYDLPPMQYFDRFGFGPPWASAITLNNPQGGFGDPYAGYPGGSPFPLPIPPTPDARFAAGGQYANLPLSVKPTYLQQWNLNLQQQMSADWLFSINYLGNKGTHLWFQTQQDPAVYIPGNCGSKPCSTVANTNSRRVLSLDNPQAGAAFSSIILVDDGGNSSYHSLLTTLNHRFSKHFSLLMNYTWSHCISDGAITSEITNSYQNPYDRAADRGNCVTDERHIFNTSAVASTPHRGESWQGWLISDWNLAPIVTAHSGLWLTPMTGTDASLTGVGFDRPNVSASPLLQHSSRFQWFNTGAYSKNLPGTYGNSRSGSIEGPGGYNIDLALYRTFPFGRTEHPQSVELRIEAFNCLNHPTLQNPSTTFVSSNFGTILSANDPRIMQAAVKYVF